MMRHPATALFALLLAGGVANAQERTLHWKSLDVSARLEADASLHVVERHEIVFDGAWNGGERSFRIRPGQQITLRHLRRITDGGPVELTVGSLAATDRFACSGHSLRWRTRQPDDPPYHNETLTFELDYALYGIIEKNAEGYRIDHDFAFPDRSGPIERFTLRFEYDPIWKAEPVPPQERTNLPAGEGVVLHQQVAFTGEGEPAHIYRRPPLPPPPPPPPPPWTMSPVTRAAGVGALLGVVAALIVFFFRREMAIGRFEKWDELLPENETWLQKNIFSFAPEVVGAAWDETSAEAEVSALLARLIQEGKIKAVPKEINKQVKMTELHLQVPRVGLEEHERALVDALFVAGDVTDRARIRTHYRTQGFDPAARLRPPLMRKLETVERRAFGAPNSVSNNIAALLIVALFFTLFSSVFIAGGLAIYTLVTGICFVVALLLARRYRSRLLGIGGAMTVMAPLALIIAVALRVRHPVGFAIAALLTIAIVWYVLRKARWHGSRELLAWRRNLVAARDSFAFELSKPEPQLKDEWTPWLVGFGLSSAMDAWAKSFAGDRPPTPSAMMTGGIEPRVPIARSQQGTPPNWTGGGGAFGGAGATGGWASELSAYATTIAVPAASPSSGGSSSSYSSSSGSSSRSSFSSSSSSSRSGGGGGGGW